MESDVQTNQPRHLVPEMIDNVVDHLHDHKPSLISCTFVSPEWQYPARYHLFSSISITGSDSIEKLPEFIAFAESKSFVPRSLRELRFSSTESKANIDADLLAHLFNLFPILNSLELDGVKWSSGGGSDDDRDTTTTSSPNAVANHPKTPRPFQVLKISNMEFYNIHQFIDLLSFFSKLQRLTINNIRIHDCPRNFIDLSTMVQGLNIPFRIPIESITVSEHESNMPAIQVLRRIALAHVVKALDIGCTHEGSVPALKAVIRDFGPHLHRCSLNLPIEITNYQPPVALDLSSCKSLRYLQLTVCMCHLNFRLVGRSWDRAISTLRLAPSTIKHIVLVLVYGGESSRMRELLYMSLVEFCRFFELNQELVRFRNLREITLQFDEELRDDEMVRLIVEPRMEIVSALPDVRVGYRF